MDVSRKSGLAKCGMSGFASRMTSKEEAEIKEALNLVVGRTTNLFRQSLQQKAWIQVLRDEIIETLEKRTGEPKDAITAALEQRQKAVYQKFLEEIENKHPARAAEMDNRGPDEISL